jgi:hypothetical protein
VKEALFLFADNEARDTFPIRHVLLDHLTKFGEWLSQPVGQSSASLKRVGVDIVDVMCAKRGQEWVR